LGVSEIVALMTPALRRSIEAPALTRPAPDSEVPDEELEWAICLALEVRRRVKEQQKRIGSAEFRNTQFSYTIGLDGIEQFVSTPELQSEGSIGGDPLPPQSGICDRSWWPR
jgi:predicted ATP-dependent Lon-type protease